MMITQPTGPKYRIKVLLSFILSICFGAGCNKVPPEYETFLQLPSNQQQQEMRKLPLDKQMEYYFAGLKYSHPPNIGLANPIAEQGKSVLPFLMERLKKEKDENKKADIVFLFEVMHASYYNLKDEKEVISLLKETAANAKSPELRRRTEEALRLILENKLPDPIKLFDAEKKSS